MKLISLAVLIMSSLAAYAQAQSVEVWAVPSVYKVRPDEPAQNRNLVWDKSTKTVSLAGAKNQHVSFQMVISVPKPTDEHHPAASGFFVEAGKLVSGKGQIPAADVKLYFEHVVFCYGASGPVGGTGFLPDALAPLTDPFGMTAEFGEAIRNRGVWVDVITPADAPAGNYSGTIRVTQNGQEIDRLNLRLKVYDFALPAETHLITYMGVASNDIAHFHHLPPASPEVAALLREYHAFLYAHRMEPWFNEPLLPQIKESSGDITLSFDADAYNRYMNQWKTKRVILEIAPQGVIKGTPAFSEEANRRVKSYLKQVCDYYRKNGWLSRLVFNSPIDEPNSAEAYEETRKWATLVHEGAPGVPFLATKTPVSDLPGDVPGPYDGRPAWGTLRGFVNNFSIHGNALNGPRVRETIREEQAKGGEITWYASCDQAYPQPNFFIDAPAMDPLMMPWITWRYGMQGILYWDLKHWNETTDPWVNPVTYLSGFLCSGGYVLNGEGSVLYPGSGVKEHTGQANVNGPVSSIRFELLLEGIEDYECLWLLKSLGDEASADDAAKSMVVDVKTFSRNVEDLFALREKMAQRIEQLARSK